MLRVPVLVIIESARSIVPREYWRPSWKETSALFSAACLIKHAWQISCYRVNIVEEQ